MRPLKAMTGSIGTMKDMLLHIVLTEEDGVIVARCLDFSVSSHGENEQEALAALSESIVDYLDYAIQRGALTDIIDPEEEQYWQMFQKLKLQDEFERIKTYTRFLKPTETLEVSYA